jgi:hypothetical protein
MSSDRRCGVSAVLTVALQKLRSECEHTACSGNDYPLWERVCTLVREDSRVREEEDILDGDVHLVHLGEFGSGQCQRTESTSDL